MSFTRTDAPRSDRWILIRETDIVTEGAASGCPRCAGRGWRPLYTNGKGRETCATCNGRGLVPSPAAARASLMPARSMPTGGPKLERPFRGRHP